jgi:hypothetical protein
LDRVYLEVRCKLLDVAAMLDRIERLDGDSIAADDPRLLQFREALAVLSREGTDRAERIQMLFSDPYVANWSRGNKK